MKSSNTSTPSSFRAFWLKRAQTWRIGLLSAVILGSGAIGALAQDPYQNTHLARDWFAQFGGGWAAPDSKVVDDTWTVDFGVGYQPDRWPVGLILDVGYADFDISRGTINKINNLIAADPANDGHVDNGSFRNWQVNMNTIWYPSRDRRGFYVTGGIGANFIRGELRETGLVYYPPIYDPWWWWYVPGGVGTANIVRERVTATRFGWNLGMGWSFDTREGQFYVEAKYQVIDTPGSSVHYIPITAGLRW